MMGANQHGWQVEEVWRVNYSYCLARINFPQLIFGWSFLCVNDFVQNVLLCHFSRRVLINNFNDRVIAFLCRVREEEDKTFREDLDYELLLENRHRIDSERLFQISIQDCQPTAGRAVFPVFIQHGFRFLHVFGIVGVQSVFEMR